ncbi:MAG TPA: hypothetical protein PL089_11185 [Ignavibacteria bacterium]|nr:hypothetical protein [Ignavibacteria bacterium]
MRTKQVRPDKLEFEYELFISRELDKTIEKEFIQFDFRTKKVFEYFLYKINVETGIDPAKSELKFNIEGLSAPSLDISKSGTASFQYKFYDFKNVEYTLSLLKYGKNKAVFKIKISPKSIKITHEPAKKFLKVFTKKYNVS